MQVALFLLLLLSVQQPKPSPSPRSAQKDSAKPAAETHNQIAVPSPGARRPDSSESKQQGKTEEENRDDAYDRRLNHAYEWATIAGVVGGWIVLLIVRRQSQSVINVERAWLMVQIRMPASVTAGMGALVQEIGVVTNQQNPESDRHTLVALLGEATNQGKTPAWIFEWKVWCDFQNLGECPVKPDYSRPYIFKDKGLRPVPVGAESFRAINLKLRGTRGEDQFIRIYGMVRYLDIFGKKRASHFGWGIWERKQLMPIDLPAYHKIS